MNSKEIEYVSTIAEYKSISKAAAALYIAQPSLSRYIKNLENDLGVELFDRSTAPLELTVAGQRFLYYAEAISSLLIEMESEFNLLREKPAGRLNLGVPLVIGDYILPRILPKFLNTNSSIEIIPSLDYTPELIDSLVANKLDVIISADTFIREGFIVEQIAKDDILLVANKNHPALADYDTTKCDIYHPLTINLKALEKEMFILCDPKMILYHTSLKIFKHVGIKPTNIKENPSIQLTMELAAQGLGFAFIMKSLIKYGRFEVANSLCPIKITDAVHPVYLIFKESHYDDNPVLRLLISHIRDEYQNKEL